MKTTPEFGFLCKKYIEYLMEKFPDFKPVEEIAEGGEWDYSVHAWYVFRNKNGSYAVIKESHCSCYSFTEEGAWLEQTLPDLDSVITWAKKRTEGDHFKESLYKNLLEYRIEHPRKK